MPEETDTATSSQAGEPAADAIGATGAITITAKTGYAARFFAWDGSELAIAAPHASPPGARLEGTIDGLTLRLKVHRCRRLATEEPSFLVVGRPLDLRRQTRDALDLLARGAPECARIDRW